MAITITTAQIKTRLNVTTTSFDTAIGNIITEMVAGLSKQIHSSALSTYEAACELGMRDIIAGECLNMMKRKLGSYEAVEVSGMKLSIGTETGEQLIERGLSLLAPFTLSGYLEYNLNKAESDLKIALSSARAAYASDIAEAERDRLLAEADKMEADKQMSLGYAADANGRAGINEVRKEILELQKASLTGGDGSLHSNSNYDGYFAVNSGEYI